MRFVIFLGVLIAVIAFTSASVPVSIEDADSKNLEDVSGSGSNSDESESFETVDTGNSDSIEDEDARTFNVWLANIKNFFQTLTGQTTTTAAAAAATQASSMQDEATEPTEPAGK